MYDNSAPHSDNTIKNLKKSQKISFPFSKVITEYGKLSRFLFLNSLISMVYGITSNMYDGFDRYGEIERRPFF